jgi:surface antigen
LVVGLIAATTTPAVADSPARSCDAVCAETTVHSPGKANTTSVHWKHYPYATQQNLAAIDPWGSTERQCTGYATWALNAMGVDFGVTDLASNGRIVTFDSASGWAKAAKHGGWTVSHTPVVGSVAQWNANETSHWHHKGIRETFSAGSDGHVAIVTKVHSNGTVLVSQYDVGKPARAYSTAHLKAPRYIYLGVK